MRICEHCGAGIPNYAGFCGMCGQLITISEPTNRTVWKSPHTPAENKQTLVTIVYDEDELASDNPQTLITTAPADDELASDNPQTLITTAPVDDEFTSDNQQTLITAVPADDELTAEDEEEDEEERRRRLALIETSLPLLIDVIAAQATGGIPAVQGTPQISDVPTVQGNPQVNGAPTVPQTPAVTGNPPPFGAGAPLILPNVETGFSPPFTNTPYPTGQPGTSPHIPKKPQPQPASGCTTIIILVFIVPFLILGSIVGIGFTFLAPALSLTGSANVAVGSTLQLSGSHFIPGNTVTCVLDGGAPLSISSSTSSYTHAVNSSITGALLFANQSNSIAQTRGASANTTIIVGGDGTFHVTFAVSQSWKLGKHTIRATEALSPRSASITFTVTNTNTSPTVTSTTPTTTIPSTATPTTATPTLQATPGLSAVTPNSITFGPISVGYTQPVSTQVILNTTGTQLFTWAATWDQTQAPWLQMNIQSGQIQAPNAQTVVVSASVRNLQAGTYNSIITFTNTLQNAQTFALPISLTVQTGCITLTPSTLNFTATLGGPDPAAQTVALNNCGALGNWSEAITGGSWLQVSPTGGTLNNGATQNVVVSTTLANAKSGATTYQGQIMFSNGTVHTAVNVTLIVQSIQKPAVLSVTPTTISTRQQCSFTIGTWICPGIIVSSSQTATSALNWTATASGITGIIVVPSSGTLQPGQTTAVQIDIPRFRCAPNGGVSATVTFTGPANSIPVTISC